MQTLKVAVIMGGTSFERDFSLKSGKLVTEALESAGLSCIALDAGSELVDTLRAEKPATTFICMHGRGGEDGAVPALLEFLRIPFVGSRAPSCRAAWNKADMPFVMRRAYPEGSVAVWPAQIVLPASAFADLGAARALDAVPERLGDGGGFPLAVKPVHGGSAMGLSRVDDAAQLGDALMAAFAFDDSAIIQAWIEGVELSVTVLEDARGARALAPVEICVKEGLYDTDARTDPSRVEWFCPPRESSVSSEVCVLLEQAALEVFSAYECRDLARVDMIWDGSCVRVMGIKTFPGLTETSLVPMALEASGLDLAETLASLVKRAEKRGN